MMSIKIFLHYPFDNFSIKWLQYKYYRHKMKEQNAEGSYVPSRYSKALTLYSRTQIKNVLPFLNSISKTCQYSSQYPVCKVLRAVSKIFLLNEIEIIFLAYLIRQTNWDIRDKTLFSSAQQVQDIVCYQIDCLDYKRLILYLLITAFTVKYYLNQKSNEAMEEGAKRCPNFKNIFQNWAKKHASITTKINPRTLNIVYKQLYSNIRNQKSDFNILVDAILQISPAYNPERQKANRQEKKKTYQREVQQVKKQQLLGKQQKSGFFPAPPLFSSSGILGLIQLSHQDQQRKQSVSGLNPFMSYKSVNQQYRGMLGSSVFRGFNNNFQVKDEDCGELILGLHEGQSEQNMYFDQNRNMEPHQNASMISLNGSRALSIAEKYIAPQSKMGKGNSGSE